jgi:hypothetical protein
LFTKTKSSNFVKLYATNSTSASITNPIPTTTEPSGDGVFDLRQSGHASEVYNFGELLFFGAGSDDNAGTAKVYLWFQLGTLWIPVPILNLDLTLSTAVGVAGTGLINTDRIVDIIGLTSGTVNVSANDIQSPANNTAARIQFDLTGAAKVEVRFAKGTATNLNAILRGF